MNTKASKNEYPLVFRCTNCKVELSLHDVSFGKSGRVLCKSCKNEIHVTSPKLSKGATLA